MPVNLRIENIEIQVNSNFLKLYKYVSHKRRNPQFQIHIAKPFWKIKCHEILYLLTYFKEILLSYFVTVQYIRSI